MRSARSHARTPHQTRACTAFVVGFCRVRQTSDTLRAEFIDRSTGRVIDAEVGELPEMPADFPDVASPHAEPAETEAPTMEPDDSEASASTHPEAVEMTALSESERSGAVAESTEAEPAPPAPDHAEAPS
jgi:hypothetical protein